MILTDTLILLMEKMLKLFQDEDYADLTKEEKKKYENIKIDRIVFARKEEKVLHYNLSV